MDYSTEPEVVFSPLPPKRYCEFYDLELSGFTDDLQFYLASVDGCRTLLEAGCGSGRLSRALAVHTTRVTAIDISQEMLVRAALGEEENIAYVCMDMADMAFATRFDAVIVAYNTINLLADESQVRRCLNGIRHHLKKNGLLLVQIFLPDGSAVACGKARTFQFQILTQPDGGKIIKETLRYFTRKRHHIVLEERYRVRPFNKTEKKEDLIHSMNLLALSCSDWCRLITGAGFSITGRYGSFDLAPFTEGNSLLLLKAKAW